MSASASRNNNSNNNSKKPYCKVCHDAGKPEREYTSHCVKTYDLKIGAMKVTCPTLLALECRYCGKNGHTVKFCQVLEETKKQDAQRMRDRERTRPQQQQVQAPVKTQNKPKNAFAVFAEEQENDERQAKKEFQAMEEFPTLMGKNTRVAQNTNAKSYSCVASTPANEMRLELSRQQRSQKAQAPKKDVSWIDEEVHEYDEQQEVAEHISLEEMYGDRIYEILLEYFKNDNVSKLHPERTATVVGKLLERDIAELEEFMTNRIYLEDAADEIFATLHYQLDPPMPGVIHNIFRDHDEDNCSCHICREIMTRTLAEDNDW
jgi:Nanos RNA binding domain